jgi:chemotaxis family two-component system response regulator Rcp1
MEELAPLVILLVEDDLADQKLIKLSLKNQKLANEVHTVQTGEEGMDFLYYRGKYNSGTPQPDLILLDLNMPGMGGKEFLRRIKEDETLRHIPVIILTTSEAEKDIIDSYKLQASGYVHKPVTLEEFKEAMQKIKEYWFLLCKRVPK